MVSRADYKNMLSVMAAIVRRLRVSLVGPHEASLLIGCAASATPDLPGWVDDPVKKEIYRILQLETDALASELAVSLRQPSKANKMGVLHRAATWLALVEKATVVLELDKERPVVSGRPARRDYSLDGPIALSPR